MQAVCASDMINPPTSPHGIITQTTTTRQYISHSLNVRSEEDGESADHKYKLYSQLSNEIDWPEI
jgi:hypothetical protein